MEDSNHGLKIAGVVIGIIILLGAIAGVSYWIYRTYHPKTTPTKPWSPVGPSNNNPPNPPNPPTYSGVPCPAGWTRNGTVCSFGSSSIDLQGKTIDQIRDWAQQHGLSNWPELLCPPGYTGIGTSTYPCVNPSAHCPNINFDTDEYKNNPENLIKWAQNCQISSWPGVTCPVGWTGLGSQANPCENVNKQPNEKCHQARFDMSPYTTFASLTQWAQDCNLSAPFYGAGKA